MSERLNTNATIRTMAKDLGLATGANPVQQISRFCEQRIARWLTELPGKHDAATILQIASAKLDTQFVEVHSEAELAALQKQYVRQGETGFACLREDFETGTLGITLRRLKRLPFEPKFISVINCVGRNRERAYFTKWHELVHLLTLTDQTRLAFKRTHVVCDQKDPEEMLTDVVAGVLAYHPKLLRPFGKQRLTFALIDQIHGEVFAISSRQAALIGISYRWPKPCILLRVELATKRDSSKRELRAVVARPNQIALDQGVVVIPKFRVPESSVVFQAYHGGKQHAEATEALELWTSSDGSHWSGGNFHVEVQTSYDGMQVLLSRN